jgi:hypothetical protein
MLEFESETFRWFYYLYLVRMENHVCLSRGVYVAGGSCGMAGNDEDRSWSRRPGVEVQGWSHRLGTRWPDDRNVG